MKAISIFSLIFLASAKGPYFTNMVDNPAMIEMTRAISSSTNPLLDKLIHNTHITAMGKESDLRPLFVEAQKDVEMLLVYLLQTNQISKACLVIHAPSLATPLCTKENPRSEVLVNFLEAGGTIYSLYTKEGFKLRSKEEIHFFQDLKEKYKERLFSFTVDEIPYHCMGATAFIEFPDQEYLFSIQGRQSNDIQDGEWALWFGKASDAKIQMRKELFLNYFGSYLK